MENFFQKKIIFIARILKHSLDEENDTDNTENITGYWGKELKIALFRLVVFYKIHTAMKMIMAAI
ncbi:hypothetical protein AT246_03595 [Bartonella henselae]|uniref:Uncharacterized protein n=1 Tax=Bartonella henselae TaxID=38323 RepID=X5M317_BARHN|nr:hypothetical protein [Bartonella henselae]MDM9996476.1 hypothetical protein [Bartonella henselae]OLL47620.1 hypothetical protein AT247_03055 [Bartonella henselae]OLL50140.1 hypothetical protein AT243_00620 [Bartonella henselae]OLL50611.1 hypothetical protein AT241_07005 [Bartonella henselae]OLL56402.1 hypothetical protein AT246_03595 [Bartonella henselae]